ncbi:unnamed protein product [Dibothriocephalus latus]|uniref:Uncharacterized protein n=1 Tax=Dibothriocephalus latus TaxID=60516 RepID=A0A3P6SKF3_DIBLA|nr:unnamed protein product [Dibothriocephalus latus]
MFSMSAQGSAEAPSMGIGGKNAGFGAFGTLGVKQVDFQGFFTPPSSTEAPKDILLTVAELQNFTGFWKLEAELADLLDCQLEMLKSTKPRKLAGVEDAVWATALVIAFLKTKVADRRLEWKLMSKKAQGWLASTLKSNIPVDELIKEATSVLEATSNAVKPQK